MKYMSIEKFEKLTGWSFSDEDKEWLNSHKVKVGGVFPICVYTTEENLHELAGIFDKQPIPRLRVEYEIVG